MISFETADAENDSDMLGVSEEKLQLLNPGYTLYLLLFEPNQYQIK